MAKIMRQSTYLCVIVQAQTTINSGRFSLFLIRGKIKDGGQFATMFSDVTGLQQRNHP